MICELAKDEFTKDRAMVKLDPPVHVVGDIHGQFYDLLRIFEAVGQPPDRTFLFLGNYVDRGPQSIEVITLLLTFKILFPERIFLLRGNHECPEVNEINGFKSECVSRYSPRLWNIFNDLFAMLPLAAAIGDKIFATHAGISPDLKDIRYFTELERPVTRIEGVMMDLLWSDPDPQTVEWTPNPRGRSVCFGLDQAREVLDNLGFEILVRSHQIALAGFEFPFEPDRSVVTIYSAPIAGIEAETPGTVMTVNESFECSFTFIKPLERRLPPPVHAVGAQLDQIVSIKDIPASRSSPNRKW
jgi:serine/threonine-protein phosphatase PP1 catalytic subunit